MKPRVKAWSLANDLWREHNDKPLPVRVGDILGCRLANYTRNGKPDRGKNRLYRILMSETAYLIWRMRNERRIRDKNNPTVSTINELTNRGTHAINKRLTVNRALTDITRFGRKAISSQLVKATWSGCPKNKEDLPDNWYLLRGVLVGIVSVPPGAHLLEPLSSDAGNARLRARLEGRS